MTTPTLDRSSSRRTLVLGGLAGLAGTLALNGCTPPLVAEAPTGIDQQDLGDRVISIGVDPLIELEPVAPQAPGRLETSAGLYVLTGTHLARTLDPELAAALRISSEPSEEEIIAPEGEEFLFFALEIEPVSWGLTRFARRPDIVVRIQRPGGAVELDANWATIPQHHMVQVLADPGPEDAVLEVSDHEKVQRLSLIDGSLLDSEVRHIYDRHLLVGSAPENGTIRLEDRLDAAHETADLEVDRLTLETLSVLTAPLTARLGWAPDGEQFVGARVRAAQSYSPAYSSSRTPVPVDPAISVLRLADGTELIPVDIEDSATAADGEGFSMTESLLWFAVPVDLEVAQLMLRVEPFPRRADLAELLDTGAGLTSELAFEPGQ